MTYPLDQRFLTLTEAGVLLGGDQPYSTKTIQRLVGAGRLVAVGDRRLRRITRKSIESLIAELEEGKPLWPAKSVAPTAPAAPIKTRKASDSRRSRLETATSKPVVSLINRRATRGANS